MYIGVAVGCQRRCKACQSLRELDNQLPLFLFLFWQSPRTMVIELDHIVKVGEPKPARMVASRSVNMVRHSRGSYTVIPIAAFGVAHQKTK